MTRPMLADRRRVKLKLLKIFGHLIALIKLVAATVSYGSKDVNLNFYVSLAAVDL